MGSDTLGKLAAKYGVAGAIALFLVWWLAGDVSGQVTKIQDALTAHVAETNFYLRQICVNTAQNEAQRAGCWHQ